MKNDLFFSRLFRTPYSEVWTIDLKRVKIGTIHLHFQKAIVGDVILTKKLNEVELEEVLGALDKWIVETIEDREDFIYSVYDAVEIGDYYDIVDHNEYPPTLKDLKEQKILINTALSKYQDVKGQLQEHIVNEFFIKLGFSSKKGDSKLDAQKIDLIAENDLRVLFCQVKLGKIDVREINKVCTSISKIVIDNSKKKTAVIVAESFPDDIEMIKEKIEENLGLKVWTISKSQILRALPEYKRTS